MEAQREEQRRRKNDVQIVSLRIRCTVVIYVIYLSGDKDDEGIPPTKKVITEPKVGGKCDIWKHRRQDEKDEGEIGAESNVGWVGHASSTGGRVDRSGNKGKETEGNGNAKLIPMVTWLG